MKKSHSFYIVIFVVFLVVVFLAGNLLLDHYLYKLTGFHISTLATLLAIAIVLSLFGCLIEWFDRPRKRTFSTHADKMNALVEFFRARDQRTEAEQWSQFKQWYPELSQQEIGELKDHLYRMQHIAYNLALQHYANELNRKESYRALAAEFPELNSKSLERLFDDAVLLAR